MDAETPAGTPTPEAPQVAQQEAPEQAPEVDRVAAAKELFAKLNAKPAETGDGEGEGEEPATEGEPQEKKEAKPKKEAAEPAPDEDDPLERDARLTAQILKQREHIQRMQQEYIDPRAFAEELERDPVGALAKLKVDPYKVGPRITFGDVDPALTPKPKKDAPPEDPRLAQVLSEIDALKARLSQEDEQKRAQAAMAEANQFVSGNAEKYELLAKLEAGPATLQQIRDSLYRNNRSLYDANGTQPTFDEVAEEAEKAAAANAAKFIRFAANVEKLKPIIIEVAEALAKTKRPPPKEGKAAMTNKMSGSARPVVAKDENDRVELAKQVYREALREAGLNPR